MKKPSTQIIDIVTGLTRTASGQWLLPDADKVRIIELCKATDKRDQQLRKGKKPPAAKAAKRKARR